ncbi:MAG: redoxin domain-containing protein [Gemmatimonadales bacterium]
MNRRWCLALVAMVAARGAAAQDTSTLTLRFSLEEGAHVGRRAPAVVLPYATADSAGPVNQPFDLSRELGHVVVLIFYPGNAAPGATDDWRAIAAHETRPAGSGVVVAGISPDSIAAQLRFARELQLPFKLLSDRSLDVARHFGAVHNRSIVPLLVVVGRGGRVRYVDPQFAPRAAERYVHLDAAIQAARELQ